MKKPKRKKPNEKYSPGMIEIRLYTSRSAIPNIAPLPLAKSLSLLPEEVIDFVIENYLFISQPEKLIGAHYTLDDLYLRGKAGFILLFSKSVEKEADGDKVHHRPRGCPRR